uniref:Peptidase A1 domain-containing protein n=1 Tax=Kalanchoe fedtschenkoi TaxID=63787 RepID=A0A7N0RG81_KALFE
MALRKDTQWSPVKSKSLFFLVVAAAGFWLSTATKWSGVAELPLHGNPMIYSDAIYQAKVKVGTPARAFDLRVDTGTDITWVRCQSSKVDDTPNAYDVSNSSSGSIIKCGDQWCGSTLPTSQKCTNRHEPCWFSITYKDGSGASGYYVSEKLLLMMKGSDGSYVESPVNIMFGCATERHGYPDTDGTLGLYYNKASLISQLDSQGKVPGVFSHCLTGQMFSKSFHVLGEVTGALNMSYTPLILWPFHYNIKMESIDVDGKKLIVNLKDSSYVDSGTTLMYLVPEIYHSLIATVSFFTY